MASTNSESGLRDISSSFSLMGNKKTARRVFIFDSAARSLLPVG
jgi:hypothetical protein